MGEASHGTSEYYTWRARLSRRLIQEHDFSFIAVEGDWPDCYAINRYLQDFDDADERVRDVLQRFERWPTWMWANWEVAALIEWLREHNDRLPPQRKTGFYGLDVYSLWESMTGAEPGSWEAVLHEALDGDRLLLMDELRDVPAAEEWRGHRAIGVVYHPEYEYGNYVPTVLPQRYDALLHIDDSQALHPLHMEPREDRPPELYPWGL